jgi:hypothetical protein
MRPVALPISVEQGGGTARVYARKVIAIEDRADDDGKRCRVVTEGWSWMIALSAQEVENLLCKSLIETGY